VERDRKETDRTTLIFRVVREEEEGEGFAGKVFLSEGWAQSVDNVNINEIIARIPKEDWPEVRPFESSEDSVSRLMEANFMSKLGEIDWDRLQNFMISSNTNLDLLLAINPRKTKNGKVGLHCNHFIGFKIYRDQKVWGVVTVDALDERPFRELIRIKRRGSNKSYKRELDSWLEFLLEAFSKTFSGVVSRVVQ
jgi:hypothetical protein